MSRGESRVSTAFLILLFVAGLIISGIITSYIFLRRIGTLEDKISAIESQVSNMWGFQNVTYQDIKVYQNGTALSEIYEKVKDSVVLIRGVTSSGSVQGSGFVCNYSGSMIILTNNHVVDGTTSITVAFSDGDAYVAAVRGVDPYSDLAVLTVNAPESEFSPLQIVSSSTLRVGDPVMAIGNPYGLVGSMTTGVVSALGRTITEQEYTGGYAIANIIQTSTPINPGNSGGPLLNMLGNVVGITTAIVANSQGLGFAVPSNTILRETSSLVETGTYEGHSYLGVKGTDMDYTASQELGVNVTYGWRISEVVAGGPAAAAGVQVNDVIVGFNGTRIRNGDEMSSYLEENTLPAQTLTLNIARGSQWLGLSLMLGKRPPP